jgi:hypothetical protein
MIFDVLCRGKEISVAAMKQMAGQRYVVNDRWFAKPDVRGCAPGVDANTGHACRRAALRRCRGDPLGDLSLQPAASGVAWPRNLVPCRYTPLREV